MGGEKCELYNVKTFWSDCTEQQDSFLISLLLANKKLKNMFVILKNSRKLERSQPKRLNKKIN